MAGYIHPDRAHNNPTFGSKDIVPMEFDFGSGMPLPPTTYQLNAAQAIGHPGFKEETPYGDGRGIVFNGGPAGGHSSSVRPISARHPPMPHFSFANSAV